MLKHAVEKQENVKTDKLNCFNFHRVLTQVKKHGLIVIFGVFGFFAFHDWLWKNSYREKTEFFPYKNEKN